MLRAREVLHYQTLLLLFLGLLSTRHELEVRFLDSALRLLGSVLLGGRPRPDHLVERCGDVLEPVAQANNLGTFSERSLFKAGATLSRYRTISGMPLPSRSTARAHSSGVRFASLSCR